MKNYRANPLKNNKEAYFGQLHTNFTDSPTLASVWGEGGEAGTYLYHCECW